MASFASGEPSSSHHGYEGGGGTANRAPHDRPDEVGGRWYMSRKEIEENSPSRKDGIDLKKETYLRKSYCTFLQDLGIRLRVPQVTIATAIIFCHRFFLRQSHAKNDRRTIATVCMFLAGKVEETPHPLKDVIVVSYEIIHKKDPAAVQRIKQKEVYEQQKELILLGERVVLATLGFDLNVHHPYKPLVEAIKKFKVAQNALAQVAWNFVNDGLRTSLCLQFKPHHIAAGATFLAAKFLKVKLPSDGEKVWWQEFDVTPRQLEEVSNQMLELYEQNRVPPSQGSEPDGGITGASNQRAPSKAPPTNEERAPASLLAQAGTGSGSTTKPGTSKQPSSRFPSDPSDSHRGFPGGERNQNNDNGSTEMGSVITEHNADGASKDDHYFGQFPHKDDLKEAPHESKPGAERVLGENETGERRENGALRKSGGVVGWNLEIREGPVAKSPQDAIKMIDKNKVKAALEKRRKARGEISHKKDPMDEDDLIERELEDGVELAAEDEKLKRERRQSWPKNENPGPGKDRDGLNFGEGSLANKGHRAEEGEMLEGGSMPAMGGRKRKGSPLERQSNGKQRHDYSTGHHHGGNRETAEDRYRVMRGGHAERDYRKQTHESYL